MQVQTVLPLSWLLLSRILSGPDGFVALLLDFGRHGDERLFNGDCGARCCEAHDAGSCSVVCMPCEATSSAWWSTSSASRHTQPAEVGNTA